MSFVAFNMSPLISKDVQRFKAAQVRSWPTISRELATGRKRTHWMWFVFPQLRGLAKSETAQYFGIRDRDEALAYLDDKVLRVRLAESTMAVLRHPRNMFSEVDRRKLRSCMTLFREVTTDPTLPDAVLAKFYGGELCPLTLDLLAGRPIPQQWTAQGRVEIGHRPSPRSRPAPQVDRSGDEPMQRDQIIAFLKGLGLTSGLTRRITEEWLEDQERAFDAGFDQG